MQGFLKKLTSSNLFNIKLNETNEITAIISKIKQENISSRRKRPIKPFDIYKEDTKSN
jgi:hypothetical protein